jgi:hypothetical protein
MTLSALGIFSAAGAGGVFASDYELIETYTLGSNQGAITFSSLATYASTYRHLQIRFAARGTHAVNGLGVRLQFNGITSSSYSTHGLYGTGSTVGAFGASSLVSMYSGLITGSAAATNNFGASVVDILDAYSSIKNKTVRSMYATTTEAGMHSGAFLSTSSTTSLLLFPDFGDFVSGSRFSLYGIKG